MTSQLSVADMQEISFLETNHLQVDPFHTDFKYQLQLETGTDIKESQQ